MKWNLVAGRCWYICIVYMYIQTSSCRRSADVLQTNGRGNIGNDQGRNLLLPAWMLGRGALVQAVLLLLTNMRA